MRIRPYHNSRRGFSFLELLFALAILSVGLTHIFRIFFGSISALVHTQNRTNALLMLDEMYVHALSYLHHNSQGKGSVINDQKGSAPTFHLLTEIRRGVGSSYLHEASFTVSWKESGINKKINRTAYIRGF